MHEYFFNPFKKNLEEVSAKDLAMLRDISEGWYIEYKREEISQKDFAKHLASFANQYGGLLFIGIREQQDGSRKAGSFDGIPKKDVPTLLLTIREASSKNVNPPILYEECILDGPCGEIGLKEGKSIIIIGIPQGANPPYIHSTGKIYRRLSDKSEPSEETDRHILDELWQRGKHTRDKHSHFLEKTPELPGPQKESAWAFIYLSANVEYPGPDKTLTYESFRSCLKKCSDGPINSITPMQSTQSAPHGFVARHTKNNDPGLACFAFRWWHIGSARFDIPLNIYSIEEFKKQSNHYCYGETFIKEFYRHGFKDNLICDFSYLLECIIALSLIFINIRKEVADTRPVYSTYELCNLFYQLPFYNDQYFMKRCSEHGIPVIQERNIKFRDNPYFDNMIPLSEVDASDKIEGNSNGLSIDDEAYHYAAYIGYSILNSAGILPDTDNLLDSED